MRVLQLISSSGFFGAENMIISLMKGLSSLNCQAHLASLLTPAKDSGNLAYHARTLGFESFEIHCRGKFDLHSIFDLCGIIAHGGYDIIHSHGYKADLYSKLVLDRGRYARISTAHNWASKSPKMRAYTWLDKLALRSFTKVVAVSEVVAQELVRSGIPPRAVVLIENGVDPAVFRNGTDRVRVELNLQNIPLIGYVGRLSPEKGLDVLLKAVPEIVKYCPDVQVIFVGDGPIRNQLIELAQKIGIDARVKFLGIRRDMADLYYALDVFVLPSLDEGLPMAMLEALAARKAVVASSVGQIPAIIHDHKTGLLVQPGSQQQLTNAIVKLLKNPALMNKLSIQGQQLVDREFTAEVMASKYLQQYKLCIGGKFE